MEDFCEVPGLTVRLVETTDSLDKVTVHRDGLPYLKVHNTITDVYTNVETGKSATEVSANIERVLKVTDNGDGTLARIMLVVYNAEMYDEDSSLIGQYNGRKTLATTLDDGGTLSYPWDDVPVEHRNRVVGKAVEHGDDHCTVMVEEIG